MSRFLITGGAGFIGSHIARRLIHAGHFVRILDNFYSGKKENLDFSRHLKADRFELIGGDITNPEDCNRACAEIDFVCHQAALLSVAESMKVPLKYNQVNVDGTLFMLQAAVKQQVKRFVFASSAAVYGNSDQFPLNEGQLPMLISPYALSKLAGEYYCRIFSENTQLETVCLRYFNVFGPGQSINDEYAGVIPKFINLILKDQPIPILGSGLQTRDFVFVNNIVTANILAALTTGIKHDVFNVAGGKNITILDLAQLLNRILDKNTNLQFYPPRAGDIFKIDADISKISRALNYKPVETFEEGLRETVTYLQQKGEVSCRMERYSAAA